MNLKEFRSNPDYNELSCLKRAFIFTDNFGVVRECLQAINDMFEYCNTETIERGTFSLMGEGRGPIFSISNF